MRGYVPDYEICQVTSLQQALSMLEQQPDVWKPFAGGTDLMVLLEADQLPHLKFIDLSTLDDLRGIEVQPHQIKIRALTTYTQIVQNPVLSQEFSLLGRAALETGAVAIQNRGTLGGNIANASPAADSPPALLVYDAELELVSAQGTRTVPYCDFHTGYKKTLLKPGELIQSVILPRVPEGKFEYYKNYYRKVGARRAQAISKVCFAGVIYGSSRASISHARLAVGSVGPIPLRCTQTETLLTGQKLNPHLAREVIAAARTQLESEISPIDDIRSTSEYRLKVAGNLLEEFLNDLELG